MARENINRWSPQQRTDLATLILRFIEQRGDLMHHHSLAPLHFKTGSNFFIWHRRFLQAMENFLSQGHELPPARTGPQIAARGEQRAQQDRMIDPAKVGNAPQLAGGKRPQLAYLALPRQVTFNRLPQWPLGNPFLKNSSIHPK